MVVWRESLIFCFMAVLSTSWPVLAFAILVTGLVNQLEKFLCVARLLNGGHKARVKFQRAFFGRKGTFSPHEWANLGEAAHSPKQRRPVGSEAKPIKASIDAPTVNAITFYVAPLAIFTPGPFVRLFTFSR